MFLYLWIGLVNTWDSVLFKKKSDLKASVFCWEHGSFWEAKNFEQRLFGEPAVCPLNSVVQFAFCSVIAGAQPQSNLNTDQITERCYWDTWALYFLCIHKLLVLYRTSLRALDRHTSERKIWREELFQPTEAWWCQIWWVWVIVKWQLDHNLQEMESTNSDQRWLFACDGVEGMH